MFHRATKLVKIQLLILLLVAGCARLKQCAYEGFTRDQWQQRDRVIESLEIRPGDRGADARGLGLHRALIGWEAG